MKYYKYKIIAVKYKNTKKFDYFLVKTNNKQKLLNYLNTLHYVSDIYERQYRVDSTQLLIDPEEKNYFKVFNSGEVKKLEEKHNLFLEYITIDIDIRKDLEKLIKTIGNNKKIINYNDIINILYKKKYIEYITNILKENNIKFYYFRTSSLIGIDNVQIKIPLNWKNSGINKNKGFYNKIIFFKNFLKKKKVPVDLSTLNISQLTRVKGAKRILNILEQTKNTKITIVKNKSNLNGKIIYNIQNLIDIFKNDYKNQVFQIDTNNLLLDFIKEGYLNKIIEQAYKFKREAFKNENINNELKSIQKTNILGPKEKKIIDIYINSNKSKRIYILYNNKEYFTLNNYNTIMKIIKKYSLTINFSKEQKEQLKKITNNLIPLDEIIDNLNNKEYKKIYDNYISKYINIKYDTFKKKMYRALKNKENENGKNKPFIKKEINLYEQKVKSLLFYNIINTYIKNDLKELENSHKKNIEYINILTENYKFQKESQYIKNQLNLFNNELFQYFIKHKDINIKSKKIKYKIFNTLSKNYNIDVIIKYFSNIYGGTATNIYSVVYNDYIKEEKNKFQSFIEKINKIGFENISKQNLNKEDIKLIQKIQFIDNLKRRKKQYYNIFFKNKKMNYFQKLNYYFFIYVNKKNFLDNQERLGINILSKSNIENLRNIINKIITKNLFNNTQDNTINYLTMFDLMYEKDTIKEENLFFISDDNIQKKQNIFFNKGKDNIIYIKTRIKGIYNFFKNNFEEGRRFKVLQWTLWKIASLSSELGTNSSYLNKILYGIRKIVEEKWSDEKHKYESMFSACNLNL